MLDYVWDFLDSIVLVLNEEVVSEEKLIIRCIMWASWWLDRKTKRDLLRSRFINLLIISHDKIFSAWNKKWRDALSAAWCWRYINHMIVRTQQCKVRLEGVLWRRCKLYSCCLQAKSHCQSTSREPLIFSWQKRKRIKNNSWSLSAQITIFFRGKKRQIRKGGDRKNFLWCNASNWPRLNTSGKVLRPGHIFT